MYRKVLTVMRGIILTFGSLAVLILLIFQVNRYALFIRHDWLDFQAGFLAVAFVLVGIAISYPIYRKAKRNRRHDPNNTDLSKQEHKVLQLMSDGLSNFEIAKELSISLNTVKTHVSRILTKMDARRRTEAIRIGKDSEII